VLGEEGLKQTFQRGLAFFMLSLRFDSGDLGIWDGEVEEELLMISTILRQKFFYFGF